MPFGLSNAVATFQRWMETVLRPVLGRGGLVYVDDVVVAGRTIDETLGRLEDVFALLRKYRLVVNKKKCVFFRRQIKFLGHVLVPEGVKVDEEKIAAVQSWPVPQCKRALRAFLGLATYYRRFVP